MTDLDLYTGLPREVAVTSGPSLEQWANDARQAASVATSLAPTPFVPQSLRGRDDRQTAANITAAILTGAEVGMTPMAALRSIVVIQGTPAMTAMALRGLVQSAGHDIWIESSSDTRAVACGRRRGSEQVEKAVWTIDRARQLGLTGKDNWKKQPEAMLVARATSEVARRVAADVLLGLPYSVEEMQDTVETEPQRTARRRAQREPAPMPEPELAATPEPAPSRPESAPEPDVEPTPETTDDPITPAQLKALNAAMTQDLDLTDREDKLAYLSGALGREIGSSKDLSKSEASMLIDRIQRDMHDSEPVEPTFDEEQS